VPLPAGRGLWRLTAHQRAFADGVSNSQTMITELTGAAGRKLEQAWCTPATLTFSLDGHHPTAALVTELATDVIAWRWDQTAGGDRIMFKGIVAQSADTISEQTHTVTFTCHDYAAVMSRRMLNIVAPYIAEDQDDIAADLLSFAKYTHAMDNTFFGPGSYIPLTATPVAPNGTARGPSGQNRDRTYYPGTNIGTAFDELSKVIGGFDYAVDPTADRLNIYYPYQGVTRADLELVYGNTVAALTRTVDSGSYGNYWRVLGNNGSSDPAAAQLFSERWNADANNITVNPVGLWQGDDNAADVTVQSTLDDKAAGDLALNGTLIPTYALTLRPGTYSTGRPNMGDVVPLVVNSGRLAVNTTVRVLGLTFDIGDDGNEDVSLTVGRPQRGLFDTVAANSRDVNALTRR